MTNDMGDEEAELFLRLIQQEYCGEPFDTEAGLLRLHRWMREHGYLGEQQPPESFTCPDCQMKSFNPNDVTYRYCGNCHEFKGVVRERE